MSASVKDLTATDSAAKQPPIGIVNELLQQLARWRMPPALINLAQSFKQFVATEVAGWSQSRPPKHRYVHNEERIEPVLEVSSFALFEMARELLARSVVFSVSNSDKVDAELAAQANRLAEEIRGVATKTDVRRVRNAMMDLWIRLEHSSTQRDALAQEQARFIRFVTTSMAELAPADEWLQDQLLGFHALLSSTLSVTTLKDAESKLTDILIKQGLRNHSFRPAEQALHQS